MEADAGVMLLQPRYARTAFNLQKLGEARKDSSLELSEGTRTC